MAMELLSRLPYDHPYRWDGTKFGSGKLWRPSDLGNKLAIWLDAEDTSTIILNGSTVSQWSDKSGKNQHVVQATATRQPTFISAGFNSKPTIFFDQTDDEMACAATNVSSQGDLFFGAVFQYLSDNTNWRPIVSHNASSSTANAGTLLMQRISQTSTIGVHDSGRVDTGTAFGVQLTDFFEQRIATVGRTGGALGDGGALTITATGPSQPTYITQINQTWETDENTSRIQIGGRQQQTTGLSNANISEVVVCSENLPTAEREKLEGYFAWKWALVDKLPVAHPYKLFPPFVIDPEAQKYLRAVEAVDGEPLEQGVRLAVNDFVVGCKEDGIWNAIKASAILAGARTLGGALVPLTGGALTNNNFVSADYSRTTGLKGNGANKEISTSLDNTDLPNSEKHLSVYRSEVPATTSDYADIGMGGGPYPGSSQLLKTTTSRYYRIDYGINGGAVFDSTDNVGFWGVSRADATNLTGRYQGSNIALSDETYPINPGQFAVFSRSNTSFSKNRISFFSLGESIDLAKLDARVSTLMTAIGAAV